MSETVRTDTERVCEGLGKEDVHQWERVQHWVVCSWEASHMEGRHACFELAENGGRPYFPIPYLPDLPYPRLDDLFG